MKNKPELRLSQFETDLVEAARNVAKNAYCKYSGFPVGAVVLTTDEKTFFAGCNVENASYGLSICAEVNAVTNMISAIPNARIRGVYIYTETDTPTSPCGKCRQIISEFADEGDCMIYSFCKNAKNHNYWSLEELLPERFKEIPK